MFVGVRVKWYPQKIDVSSVMEKRRYNFYIVMDKWAKEGGKKLRLFGIGYRLSKSVADYRDGSAEQKSN